MNIISYRENYGNEEKLKGKNTKYREFIKSDR